jgi:DNA-binding MarR family transcriptional regulator
MLNNFKIGAEFMNDISVFRSIQKFKNVYLFTVEGRIVVFLIENGGTGLRDISIGLNHSQSSISSKLKILCSDGILARSAKAANASVIYEVKPHIVHLVRDCDFA